MITSAEQMYDAVMSHGILPFFSGLIPGFSIQDLTPRAYWFDEGDVLGPWDWKIDLVQSGDIAYGKFLGGKAAFATRRWYGELMNWRKSKDKYQPVDDAQKAVMAYIGEKGSASVKDLRGLLGLPKGKVDAILTRLQMDTLLITGDISRVYSGPDLRYSGWQRSAFCRPEDFFDNDLAFFTGRKMPPLVPVHDPQASFHALETHLRETLPGIPRNEIEKLIG